MRPSIQRPHYIGNGCRFQVSHGVKRGTWETAWSLRAGKDDGTEHAFNRVQTGEPGSRGARGGGPTWAVGVGVTPWTAQKAFARHYDTSSIKNTTSSERKRIHSLRPHSALSQRSAQQAPSPAAL